jgi:hypothetical protein
VHDEADGCAGGRMLTPERQKRVSVLVVAVGEGKKPAAMAV